MGVLSGLKPEKVFYYFEELCKIPHGSYHTKQISDYLVQFAKERNLECSQWKERLYGKTAHKDRIHP